MFLRRAPYHTKVSPLRAPCQEPPDHRRGKHHLTLLQEIPTLRNDYPTRFANNCQLRARIPKPRDCSSPLSAPSHTLKVHVPNARKLLLLYFDSSLNSFSATKSLVPAGRGISGFGNSPSNTWTALQSCKCFYV